VLTGKHFFAGSTLMQDLLESEGIQVIEDRVQSFESHLWDPLKHLDQEDFIEDLIS
jgi:methylated-DNA-protein-cysteine methyltransferase-like protein